MTTESYDSTAETLKHSLRVGELMGQPIKELVERSVKHDLSKTQDPELAVFNEFTPKLKDSTYGSDEYKGFLAAMGDGLAHHYAANRHHPEHFTDGVNGMTLVDLIEMLADWKAATERHTTGDLAKSLEDPAGAVRAQRPARDDPAQHRRGVPVDRAEAVRRDRPRPERRAARLRPGVRSRAAALRRVAGQPVLDLRRAGLVMTRRTAWITGFLAVTALAIGGELWAAFDARPTTPSRGPTCWCGTCRGRSPPWPPRSSWPGCRRTSPSTTGAAGNLSLQQEGTT
jgi:hypothetical protein